MTNGKGSGEARPLPPLSMRSTTGSTPTAPGTVRLFTPAARVCLFIATP
ncbi:MAG: hypothetical protein KA742_00400 [Pseudoxanthomonas sp.]|nr:hypothetical protein [Pseudoxanthomonas sp.]